MFSSIGIVFLIFWILVDIFICKIDISDSDFENANLKIENGGISNEKVEDK